MSRLVLIRDNTKEVSKQVFELLEAEYDGKGHCSYWFRSRITLKKILNKFFKLLEGAEYAGKGSDQG